MNERPGGWRQAPRPDGLPRPRPRWMVVLGTWMCLSAAWMLLSSMTSFQAMREGRRPLPPAGAEGDAMSRALRGMTESFDRAHPAALPVHAGATLAVSLAFLWVVANLISLDARGRRAAMGAAMLGIAYYVGTALFEVFVVRHGVVAAAPALAEAMAKQMGEGAPSVAELTSLSAKFMIIVPLFTGAAGVALNVVVLVFFAGRRGRAYYGVEAARADAA